jgi:hypothetical protein
MTKKPLVVLAFTSLALLGFGCSPTEMISDKLGEKAVEGIINKQLGGEGEVDLSNGTMNLKTKDGNVTYGDNVKLPSDFPKDVPLHESAKVVMASSQETSASYLGTSTETVETITAWYWKALEEKGWKKSSEESVLDSRYRQYTKDKRTLTIAIGGDPDAKPLSTSITLTVAQD